MSEAPKFLPPDFVAICDRRARKMICASGWNPKEQREQIIGFRFNPAIADWPICRQAEEEGWARELRSAMIATMSRAMRHGDSPDIQAVIPQDDWIKKTREHAERYRLGVAHQAGMPVTATGRFRALSERSKRMMGESD